MSAADRCTIFFPPDTNGPSSPQYDTFLEKKKSYPHMHTRRTDTAGPEGEILRYQEKKVYHSADRTVDASLGVRAMPAILRKSHDVHTIIVRPLCCVSILQILSEPDVVIKEVKRRDRGTGCSFIDQYNDSRHLLLLVVAI